MTAAPNSVAIVGAGIVGMSAALYLRRAGLPVAVIDPLPPGGGASYGNAGLISVESCVPIALPGMLHEVPRWLADPLAPLTVRPRYLPQALPWLLRWIAAGRMARVEAAAAALRALHVNALDRYRELLGAEFDSIIRISGQVHIWESAEPSASEAIYRRLWETHGVAAEWLSADELRQLVPQLTGGIKRAVFLPKNGHTLNPRRLVATLARLFTEAGGTVLAERVLKLVPEGSSWRVVTSSANHIVGKVVVSAGAWSMQLLRPLGIRLPLETERGYHMMLRDASVLPRLPILSRGRGFSITPMEQGLRLAGTVEIGGLDLPMNEERAYVLLRQARQVLPGLEASDFSIWMGFRPSFPDSLPVIDGAPGRRGLFLAFGHGHTGMTGGAPTGRLVKQLVAGEPADVPLAPYSARRFHQRSEGGFQMTRTRLTRRNLLIAGSAVLATPCLSSRPARAAGQVVIRNPGGAWSDTQKKYIYEPFTTETGIEVVIVPTTLTKMLAMVKSGNNELDVADAGYDGLVELDKAKALAPIDYAGWKYAKPDDIPEEYKTANTAGMALYATVLGYNTNTFPNNSEPRGWAEFWDAKKFPGARTLQDMAAGTPNLEFALIADGVPMDRVYPIDIDRAFKSMSRIKPHIKKFWDTGALSAQMLADRDVVLGSIWNGRLQAIADKGAPVAIDWTQHMLSVQAYGIFKDAKNLKNAQLYVDYAMQAKAQVGMPKELNYGPTNIKAFDMLTAAQKANLPGSPENMKRCFIQDVNWWSDNRAKVNATWSKWILT